MQSIDEIIQSPSFFALFVGTPAVCIGVAVGAAQNLGAPGMALALLGAVVHVIA